MSSRMKQYGASLSLWGKIVLVAAICKTLAYAFYTFLLSPFRGSSGARTIGKHVKLAMVRCLCQSISTAQLQFITPPVDSSYPAYAKEKGFKPEIVTLGGGLKGYWIGDSGSEVVVIWFHGGGYAIAADPGHYHFASTIVDSAKAAGKKVAVLFPAYGLAPYDTYPKQLEQGAESLRFVLDDLGRKPGDVIIGGDSAGANLALSILSHILHPHPSSTIPPLTLSAPLKGAIFLSPWFSFDTDWPSTHANKNKDSVAPFIGNTWSANFLGGAKRDEYNEPINADQGWWEGLSGCVEDVLILGGGDEILLDSIRVMMGRLEKAHPRTKTLIAKGEYHDQPVLHHIGGAKESQMGEAIRAWICGRL